MTTRVDAIGQELKVNECAYVISKSSNAGGSVGLITRLNPKTVQINGKTTMEDDRVIIVTGNLIAMGKQNRVDNLRKQYESAVDHTDPAANAKKLPIRFVLIKDELCGDQHLVRFEGDNRDAASDAMRKIPELQPVIAKHQYKMLARCSEWRTQEKYLAFADSWRFGKEVIFAFRSLPDNIARYVNENSPYVLIPQHDRQPQRQTIPK